MIALMAEAWYAAHAHDGGDEQIETQSSQQSAPSRSNSEIVPTVVWDLMD